MTEASDIADLQNRMSVVEAKLGILPTPTPVPTPTPTPVPISGRPALLPQPIATPTGGVLVPLGGNIQNAMNANPGGIIQLAAGTYRVGSLNCSDNLRIVGDPGGGTILNGGLLLSGWTLSNGRWQHGAMPSVHASDPSNFTDGSNAYTTSPQDLWVNNVFYKRVTSLASLGPGKWYWDTNGKITYMTDDPTGKQVEINDAKNILQNGVNVHCFNLTFSHCANFAGDCVNPGDQGWSLLNCAALYNHGVGIGVGVNGVIWNCRANYNGQQGMTGGDASLAQVLSCEVAFNNYAGYNFDWEAGGFKFVNSNGTIAKNNWVHHNNGVGIWGDLNNSNWLIDGNLVHDNQGAGIMYEVSYAGTKISHNTSFNNGLSGSGFIRADILLQNSQGTEVFGNTVTVGAAGNGITMTHEDRGSGTQGVLDTKNNSVHDNIIIFLGANGQVGYAEYSGTNTGGSTNHFDRNQYHAPDQTRKLFHFASTDYTWAGFRAIGQEANGSLAA